MSSEDERSERIRTDLPGAVDRGEFAVVFQPQFSLADDRIVAAESLARWLHPDLGPISPADFIPVAEEFGAIDDIGYQMIHLGCKFAAEWAGRGYPIEVAVNVSMLQLHDPGFVDHVKDCLTQTGVDPHLIILELTESVALEDVPRAIDAAQALTDLGMTISIDDFGSGFWSEEQVTSLPATELKIDQKLVQGEGDASIESLESAISFGTTAGMRTIAEGVETPEQLDLVRRLGVHRAQGFLLGRPMVPDELEDRLRAQGTLTR